MNASTIRKAFGAVVAGATLSLIPAASNAGTKPPANDWLWLSGTLTDCTFTITVNWAGFPEAKYVEVFATDGYAGAPVLPTAVRIKNKDNVMVVTMPALATSATATYWYPWAQLLDTHGNAIPASLDFSGQTLAYCAAPAP